MRVLLDSGDYHCSNLGDVAMLQVAVSRLRELWPSASIEVITQDPEVLAKHCPEAVPVSWSGRDIWLSRGTLLGRLDRVARRVTPGSAASLEDVLRRRRPGLLASLIRAKLRVRGSTTDELDEFLEVLKGADAVVVCGAGGMTDHAIAWMVPVLELLNTSAKRGVPTAMFSQGLGPLEDRDLRLMLANVLPRVGLLALREWDEGVSLLKSMGIEVGDRVMLTGDDAIELAYEKRPAELGSEIGVNLRVARSAHTDASLIDMLQPAIQRFARERHVSLVPLPIGRGSKSDDASAIRALLAGYDDESDGGASLDTPWRVVEQAGRCRVVVTGAYHAAVFSLSQGIPAVCLAKSPYFRTKFLGLAHQFGCGCPIVDLVDADCPERLHSALSEMWEDADDLHDSLLESARCQVAASRAAYLQFGELVGGAAR